MNSKLTIVVVSLFALGLCSSQRAYAGGAATDPCSLLTQAQVSVALGVNVDPGKPITPTMCGWSTSNQPKKVALLISNANAFGFAKTPFDSREKAVPASSICDDAVYSFPTASTSGVSTTLYVKKGNSYFVVHLNGFPDQAKTMAIEKTLAVEACSKL
ncbi:MAG TPA: hypothetical protein VGS05_19400 [Candidatus Sulfotelmatobacter sp.]|nr:hypothetical protein [Candidatus Sulfotelmatobacter sp.]